MILALAATVIGATSAEAQEREAWQPPTLTTTRYDEDWSVLADPARRSGRWIDDLKYVPLDDDGSIWVGTGGEIRLRSENYRNAGWGDAPAPDDGYVWARAMPYVDVHAGAVRAFVQPIVAYAAGVRPAAGPVDRTGVDLLQGFAEVALPLGNDMTLMVRGGRQMLSFGTERLIGTRYGPNVPLAFDGVRADVTKGNLTVRLLAVRPVRSGTGAFDDATSHTRGLWGAYATVPGFDLYYLGYRNRDAQFGGERGAELRHSIGVRGHGTAGAFEWNVEGVFQFGRFADQRIAAWTLATEVGYRFTHMPMTPRVMARVNMASGDQRRGDGRLGTFNALFPKGKYFGELSPVGPYNIINANPSVTLALGKGVSLAVAGTAYWRQSRGDGVYDIPGNLLRAPGNATSRFIGKEVEATLSWQATSDLELSTSLSAFAPGGF
ncbi:MAG: alginate export family protein, partial [Sphingobium sp.]